MLQNTVGETVGLVEDLAGIWHLTEQPVRDAVEGKGGFQRHIFNKKPEDLISEETAQRDPVSESGRLPVARANEQSGISTLATNRMKVETREAAAPRLRDSISDENNSG